MWTDLASPWQTCIPNAWNLHEAGMMAKWRGERDPVSEVMDAVHSMLYD